jgi:hypothetical protein
MANASGAATFAIVAKDAASSVMGKIGKSMGSLQKTAKKLFAGIVAGALGAAGALAAFTVLSVKAAIEDAAATDKLNAALKARGFATKAVLAQVDKQIQAGQNLAFTDDEVRASIEASTRFTKKYSVATKIQTVAMNLARATGMSLESATLAVGKAYQGNAGKLLKTLGINAKAVKGQEALNLILSKTKGSAKAYGNSVEGSFKVLSIKAAELKEQFGAAFLPAVGKLFKGLAPYLDRFSAFLSTQTPKIQAFADVLVTKILDKLPMLMSQFEQEFPKAVAGIGKFVDKISQIGKGADDLLGPGGSITLLISGIGAAFGGLKGVIAANLLKNGIDPFTALVVSNILAAVPAALASAITSQIVAGAIAKFGAATAAAAAGSSVAGAAGAAAAAGAGGAAVVGGVSAATAAAAAAIPFALALGLKALGVNKLAVSGVPSTWGPNGPMTGPSYTGVQFNAYLDGKQVASSISKPTASNVRANTGTRTGGR